LDIFFIKSIQFFYIIVYTRVIFNLEKNIMFQLFNMNLMIVVLMMKNVWV